MELSLNIKTFPVGPLEANCYLLSDGGECCLIDPGANSRLLRQAVESSGCTLRYILLTHGHFDHYTAVPKLLQAYPELPVYIHEKACGDAPARRLLQRLPEKNQRYYAEGDTLPLGGLTIRVLETPGHSAGSVVLQAENVLFTGDTLFAGSCGRTDLEGGSSLALRGSLRRLAALEGDYFVLPGHGPSSTLGQERRSNYYLR